MTDVTRTICRRCLKAELTCYCAELRPFKTALQLVLLQHPMERKKAIGTARMTHFSIAGSQLIPGKEFNEDARVNHLIADPQNHCVVLYPGRDSKNISEPESLKAFQQSVAPGKQLVLFVIDGTWAHARRMVRESPNLLELPQICFTPKNLSEYKIRQQPAEFCLSTIEAVHQILGHLEPEVNADILPQLFRTMVDQQIRIAEAEGKSSVKRLPGLVAHFNRTFGSVYNTRLVGGFEEPLYLPSTRGAPAEIRFTRDYIRSALHEIAHWCIAGEGRRLKLDYDYWYRPDGRTAKEQNEFYQVEVKPQALEWAFSKQFSVDFRVSCDNLSGTAASSADQQWFERQVAEQLARFETEGFPERAKLFMTL